MYVNFERIISAPFQVDIVDMLGNIVQSQNYKSPSASLSLDVNDLPKGIYLISILYNQERNTLRFIKE
ncbi:MAG: T9SS type A sorting domain-containing protein [Chitinophagales bacterium]